MSEIFLRKNTHQAWNKFCDFLTYFIVFGMTVIKNIILKIFGYNLGKQYGRWVYMEWGWKYGV